MNKLEMDIAEAKAAVASGKLILRSIRVGALSLPKRVVSKLSKCGISSVDEVLGKARQGYRAKGFSESDIELISAATQEFCGKTLAGWSLEEEQAFHAKREAARLASKTPENVKQLAESFLEGITHNDDISWEYFGTEVDADSYDADHQFAIALCASAYMNYEYLSDGEPILVFDTLHPDSEFASFFISLLHRGQLDAEKRAKDWVEKKYGADARAELDAVFD